MIIDDLKSEKVDGKARISASVQWEDCDRPAYELYFETDEAYADGFFCNPHAFLTGCTIPAFHYGEQRILIREEICPELIEGLNAALRFIRHWYYRKDKKLVNIEAKSISHRNTAKIKERAGFFFSGGIDSFGTLCANRRHYPPDHPRAIKDGILVFGLEQDDPVLFEHVLASLREVEDQAGLTLIPLYTNVYLEFRAEDAEKGFEFWLYKFGGSALAAVAHTFSRRFSVASIAATYSLDNLEPWASHPLIDPNFSSRDMRIIHDGVSLTRHAKLKLVAQWDPALQHIRVCNKFKYYQKDRLNCGECEKCVRTMLGLMALGALEKTNAFPSSDVSPELVLKAANIADDYVYLKAIYAEIIPGLIHRKRHDLVSAIQKKMIRPKEHYWKTKLIQFDNLYLDSRLVRFKKWILRRVGNT